MPQSDVSAAGQVQLQICASPGDDLFYYNPDLRQALAAGASVVTVYLTAGGQPDEAALAARRRGAKAAYALMLSGDANAEWRQETRALAAGLSALTAQPADAADRVRLIFLDLTVPDDDGESGESLLDLWTERVPALRDAAGASVSRTRLLESLVELMHETGPGLLRTPDPDPDCTDYDPDGGSQFADDPNRIAGAWFALEAARLYGSDAHSRPLLVDAYRGNEQEADPACLGPDTLAGKLEVLATYGGQDGRAERDGIAPGDLSVGLANYWRGYGNSTSRRFQPSTGWLAADENGRLVAALVRDGRPVLFREADGAGEKWSRLEPPLESVKGGQFAPRIELLRGFDGRLFAFGLYTVLGSSDEDHVRTVVGTRRPVGGEFEPWQDLGSPYESASYNPVRRRGVGVPTAVALTDGGAAFFERNFGTGVSGRAQTLGRGWSHWLDLGGSTRNGYSAALDREGRVELFAGGDRALLRWRQTSPVGEPLELSIDPSFQIPVPAGPAVLALENPGGGLCLYVRQADTAWVLEYRQDPADLSWSSRPRLIGEPGGYGPVAAVAVPGRSAMLLATRGSTGRVAVALAGESGPVRWTQSGPLLSAAPAVYAAEDGGRCLVAAVDQAGQLWIARVEADGDGAVSDWRPVSA